MKSEPKLRALTVKPDELDSELLRIQNLGCVVYQVLPSPRSIEYSQHPHAKGEVGSMVMETVFVVLYFEKRECA